MKIRTKKGIIVDLGKILTVILLVSACVFLLSCLVSCRTAEDHFRIAVDKGLKVEQVEKIVEVQKLVKGKDGKDSLIYVPVPCIEIQTPKTRKELRFSLRELKARERFIIDSMNIVKAQAVKLATIEGKTAKTISKQETKQTESNNNQIIKTTKQATKQIHSTNKTAFSWRWFFGFLIALVSGIIVLIFKFKR